MAIRHINKGEIALVSIFGNKLRYFTPVLAITDTPAIYRSRGQISCLRLMAHVIKLRVTRQTRSSTDIVLRALGSLNRRIVESCVSRLCAHFDHAVGLGKICCRSIRLGYQLHLALGDTAISKPAEAHMR